MKTALLFTSLALWASIKLHGQCNEGQTTYQANASQCFLLAPTITPNSSNTTAHPLLSNEWGADPTLTDEFNIAPFDNAKWNDKFWWGRTQATWLNYNAPRVMDTQYPNDIPDPTLIQQTIVNGTGLLRLAAKKQPYTSRVTRWDPDNVIQNDGRPNLRSMPYRTGMICSKYPINDIPGSTYGYIEIRAKLPKAQDVIADFWFHMSNSGDATCNSGDWGPQCYYPNQSFYHELDCFETQDARQHTQNVHYKNDCLTEQYNFPKEYFIKGAADLSTDYHTFGMQWEQNKIAYFLDNRPIHVVNEGDPDWPSVDLNWNRKMFLIIGMEMDSIVGGGRSWWSPAQYPAYFDIDYIRMFRRADYSIPYPNFTINQQPNKATTLATKLLLTAGDKISISGASAYSPNGTYFISVQEITSGGVLVGTEAMAWLTASEIKQLNSEQGFVINNWVAAKGLNLVGNKNYQIKFVSGGTQWREMRQYVYLSLCTPKISFTVNGNSGASGLTYPQIILPANPMLIGLSNTANPAILNGYGTNICTGLCTVSMRPCDAMGASSSSWSSAMLTSTEQSNLLSFNNTVGIDLFQWAFSRGFNLSPGQNFQLRIQGGSPLAEAIKIISIPACTPSLSFAINDNYGSSISLPAPKTKYPIEVTDFQPTCIKSTAQYQVFIETSDQWWGRAGDERSALMSFSQVWHLDIHTLAAQIGFNLTYGNYYRLTIGTDNANSGSWYSSGKLIYLPNCNDAPDFTINGESSNFPTPIIIGDGGSLINQSTAGPEIIRLSALNSVSCYPNKYYYLSIKRTDASGYPTSGYPEISEWLDDAYTTNMLYNPFENNTWPEGNLGWFNITKFANIRRALAPYPTSTSTSWPEYTPSTNNPLYYLISLCTDGQTGSNFQCKQRLIKLINTPKSLLFDSTEAHPEPSSTSTYRIFVDESLRLSDLRFDDSDFAIGNCVVQDLMGRICWSGATDQISAGKSIPLASGIYLVRLTK